MAAIALLAAPRIQLVPWTLSCLSGEWWSRLERPLPRIITTEAQWAPLAISQDSTAESPQSWLFPSSTRRHGKASRSAYLGSWPLAQSFGSHRLACCLHTSL